MSFAEALGDTPEDDLDPVYAADDYPMLAEILVDRPPLPHSERVAKIASRETTELDEAIFETPVHIGTRDDEMVFEAGFFTDLLNPPVTYNAPSYDWCRFRKNQRCMFPKAVDEVATAIAGYAVYRVEDRGYCWRQKWDDQQNCEVSEPGPNSRHPRALIECTSNWEDGGQRGGVPGPVMGPGRWASLQSGLDPIESSFEFTAAWSDIQAKAKRIRSEGGVRIVAVTDHTITAEVKGDSNVYQTTLMRQPGRKAVALWECGCAWASYSWGRSGRWKKYEGRMCSHALALNYEATAQEWGGGKLTEHPRPFSELGDKPFFHDPGPTPEWRVGSLHEASTFDERLGNCYELSAKFVLDHPSYKLVHGSIQGGPGMQRIPHAWAMEKSSGRVYDAVLDEYFASIGTYKAYTDCDVDVMYHVAEVRARMAIYRHWGPWHDEGYGNNWYAEHVGSLAPTLHPVHTDADLALPPSEAMAMPSPDEKTEIDGDGHVYIDGVRINTYPTYHPTRGLTASKTADYDRRVHSQTTSIPLPNNRLRPECKCGWSSTKTAKDDEVARQLWEYHILDVQRSSKTEGSKTAKDERFDGVGLHQDDDGWYVSTHRARSDSYPTPEDIPQSDVDFIESTGSKTAVQWSDFSIADVRYETVDRSQYWPEGRFDVVAYIDKLSTHLPVGRMTVTRFDGQGAWAEGWYVGNTAVIEGVRRKGIASGMADVARRKVGEVKFHDIEFTPDGAAWARSQGHTVAPDSKWREGDMNTWITGSKHEAGLTRLAQIDPEDPDAGERAVAEMCEDGNHSHSGLVIKAVDSGRVLLTQRTPYSEDPEGVRGRWEFPGGGIEEGQSALESAMREFREETGLELPEGWRIDSCYETGPYIAIVILVPHEGWTTNAELLDFETMGIGWFEIDEIDGSDLVREEMESADWPMIREALRTAGRPSDNRYSVTFTYRGKRKHWITEAASAEEVLRRVRTNNRGAKNITIVDVTERPDPKTSTLDQETEIYEIVTSLGGHRLTHVFAGGDRSLCGTTVNSMSSMQVDAADARSRVTCTRCRGIIDGITHAGPDEALFESMGALNDEPEPALPTTDGADEDDAPDATFAQDAAEVSSPADVHDEIEQQIIEDQHEASLGVDPGTVAAVRASLDRQSPLGAPDGGGDIAAAAQAHLDKLAVKTFTPLEQQEIIDEGEGVTAANLDSLDIRGTHYEAMSTFIDDDDLSVLFD